MSVFAQYFFNAFPSFGLQLEQALGFATIELLDQGLRLLDTHLLFVGVASDLLFFFPQLPGITLNTPFLNPLDHDELVRGWIIVAQLVMDPSLFVVLLPIAFALVLVESFLLFAHFPPAALHLFHYLLGVQRRVLLLDLATSLLAVENERRKRAFWGDSSIEWV